MDSSQITIHNSQIIAWNETTDCPDRYVHSFLHLHQACEVVLITGGEVEICFPSRSYLARPGDLVVCRSMEPHQFRIRSCPYRRVGIRFSREALRRTFLNPALSAVYLGQGPGFSPLLKLPPSLAPSFLKIQREFEEKGPFYLENMLYLLGQFTVFLYRSVPEAFPPVSATLFQEVCRIMEYLEQHSAEPLSMEEVASRFFISYSSLSHTFKELTGYTPKRYLILCRLLNARRYLASTSLSLEEVASLSGLESANSLIRSFKKEFLITPGQFRKTQASDPKHLEQGLDVPLPEVMDTFHCSGGGA